MEELVKDPCCFGCLCRNEENLLQNYRLRNEALKSIFQADSLNLCFLCKRITQRTELFIQNVQSNQILLENFYKTRNLTFQSDQLQTQPIVNLTSISPLFYMEYTGNDTTVEGFTDEENFSSANEVKIKVELELKEESEPLCYLEGEFVDDDGTVVDEFQEQYVKDENDFPLKALVKQEIGVNDIDLTCCKKTLKKKKVRKESKVKKNKIKNEITSIDIPDYPKQARKITITRDQCIKERAAWLEDDKYINSIYKCTDCIKGFMFRASFEKHMERHSTENGDYVCDICKQRFWSKEKLVGHKKYHVIRFKCTLCDLTRISRHTIHDHYSAVHSLDYVQYNCPHCPKVFVRKLSLRKHICYAHKNKERVECSYCQKNYANKEVLKSHMIMKHPKHVGAVELSKKHVCPVCNMGFKSPSHLKKHAIKHSDERKHYCVECDKSFKSDDILKHHLKTASPHINYLELPLPCQHCDKRFSIRRDLIRHTNRVHLNIRPHKCDKCDKAYVNGWSLKDHKRIVHEGYKRPLRFPCTFCDKVFDRNQILKGHLRTHTGERPYQCSKCPAMFSQASILGTHVKLVHLKLTREGKPKANVQRFMST